MNIDYSLLDAGESKKVQEAILNREQFFGYIPEKGFDFILRNYRYLAELKILEPNWMEAYLHSNNFSKTTLEQLKAVFDVCSKSRLQETFPIPEGHQFSKGSRYTLFRGCAGPKHNLGMSWCDSLDKAIWYAAQHSEFNGLGNLAVYATTVSKEEIYCTGSHYDFDFIVLPENAWRIDIPSHEFRLNRPR
ncbi:hypothetical protein NMS23_004339 [Vibrio parahaemolyticus]|nr:hypothetical protein [Vibrio parahaemolyticus]